MGQRGTWMPLIASIGIGAAAYQMMRPNNRIGNMIRHRMRRMWQERELFPNR
ncbi:hypothetical protein ACFO4N_17485 [Camelliibacillus cellulosilyticus]|uniref:DUF3918 domain-containing protein n=1 Tax=Camelliibacillus cellulosilyticus TaxID=2174486 RepID=A0ABV9GU95_9BACL